MKDLELAFRNEPAALLTALVITAAILLLAAAIATISRRRFRKAEEADETVESILLNLGNRTRLFLLFFPSIWLGMRALSVPEDMARIVSTVSRLSLIAQCALWAGAILDHLLRRYRRRRVDNDPAAVTTVAAFRFGALVALWIIAALVALDNLGVDVTTLITGLGIGGVAVALATQNILGDLFASLSIVLDKPFVVGDVIMSGTDIGRVEHIGLKTTRVRSLSGEQLVFSNADLLQSRVRNFQRMAERRIVFSIGVIYATPADVVAEIPSIIRRIIDSRGDTRFDRAHFKSFGESSLDFEIVYYVLSPDYTRYMENQNEINLAILREFNARKIEFAFPTRTIYLEGAPVPFQIREEK